LKQTCLPYVALVILHTSLKFKSALIYCSPATWDMTAFHNRYRNNNVPHGNTGEHGVLDT